MRLQQKGDAGKALAGSRLAEDRPGRAPARVAELGGQPIILVFCDYYLPGYKAGGPVRSISQLVAALGQEFSFRVVTRDRDLGDDDSYPGIETADLVRVGEAGVIYLPPEAITLAHLRRLLQSQEHHLVYLNSLLSPGFTIRTLLLRRLKLIPKVPVILAPRGEVSDGALRLKWFAKRCYLAVGKLFGLFEGLFWHASSNHEAEDIRRAFGPRAVIVEAPPMPGLETGRAAGGFSPRPYRQASMLKVVFLSRVSRMKNLDGALRILHDVQGNVQFDIYGTCEDRPYWTECEALLAALPPNVVARYKGAVRPGEVKEMLSQYDLLFLPTKGENYGHVIVEALSAGCPVLISDRTPWKELERKRVGWDIPLHHPAAFVDTIERLIRMPSEGFSSMAPHIHKFVQEEIGSSRSLEQNRELFRKALASG